MWTAGRRRGEWTRTSDVIARDIERLGRGELRAVVDHVFALADAADAHRYVETGEAFGRVVMTPWRPR